LYSITEPDNESVPLSAGADQVRFIELFVGFSALRSAILPGLIVSIIPNVVLNTILDNCERFGYSSWLRRAI